MSRCRLCDVLVLVFASLSATAITGCDSRPKRISPTSVNAAVAADEAMTMYDTDKDGKISGDELKNCQSLKAIAKNGVVTVELIEARISTWQKARIGRVATSIVILHNGKALPNASVKLKPEQFIGPDVKPATGTTGATGSAIMSVARSGPEEPQGVSLGFYRVEVTKDGENIPAKYNSDTTLGLAVLAQETTASFNLVY